MNDDDDDILNYGLAYVLPLVSHNHKTGAVYNFKLYKGLHHRCESLDLLPERVAWQTKCNQPHPQRHRHP